MAEYREVTLECLRIVEIEAAGHDGELQVTLEVNVDDLLDAAARLAPERAEQIFKDLRRKAAELSEATSTP